VPRPAVGNMLWQISAWFCLGQPVVANFSGLRPQPTSLSLVPHGCTAPNLMGFGNHALTIESPCNLARVIQQGECTSTSTCALCIWFPECNACVVMSCHTSQLMCVTLQLLIRLPCGLAAFLSDGLHVCHWIDTS